MKRLILCLILLVTQPGWAADTPQEFGWRVPIAINASAPYQRLTLPMAVYQNAAQLDLRDLRVFNSEGRMVPLAHMAQNGSHEKTSRNTALRWFPLTAPGIGRSEIQPPPRCRRADTARLCAGCQHD